MGVKNTALKTHRIYDKMVTETLNIVINIIDFPLIWFGRIDRLSSVDNIK